MNALRFSWGRLAPHFAVASFILFPAVASAKAPQAPPSKQEVAAAIDKLAKEVFAKADHNHNHVLNKREFQDAHELLENAVNQWGQAGMIGQPRKRNPKDKNGEAELAQASKEVSVEKLAKSNKVSPAEFTNYVHGVVDDADQRWREHNIAVAAQMKAAQAQRKAMGGNRGRFRYKRPFPL